MTTVWLFVMLMLANGAPIIAARLFRQRWSAPIDGGRVWHDGRPLLGRSKTWRGLVAGILLCVVVALLAGLSVAFGVVFAATALLGDLASSFVKRRMGLGASARAAGLDQLPEALLPMILAWAWLPIQVWQAVAVVVLFVAANVFFSPLLFRMGIRKQPH